MSIQKRGKGYVVRHRRDGRQYARTFARKEDATAYELEMKRRAQMGAHGMSVPSRQTLAEWLDSWWAIESPLWATSTRVQRKDVLDRWVRSQAGRVRLADLGSKRISEWRAQILQAGCAPTQANHALSVLSAALGSAVVNGELPSNPCRAVRKVPVRVERPRVLTPLEIETGIASMRQRDRVLVELLCYAGLRPGEALAALAGRARRPARDRPQL